VSLNDRFESFFISLSVNYHYVTINKQILILLFLICVSRYAKYTKNILSIFFARNMDTILLKPKVVHGEALGCVWIHGIGVGGGSVVE